MIDDLDEVLRQLLIRELPIKNGEVDIEFDQPKREWSAKVSRPTLNLFLQDVRENAKLRQTQPMWELIQNQDGTVTQKRKPVRIDLHYMITAWATEPEDEHRLLARALAALFRTAYLPDDLLPTSLQSQPVAIPIMAAQYDELRNPTDVWNVLDNEMRPAIGLIVTVAIDPYQPTVTPLVRTRELRVGPSPVPALQQLDAGLEPDRFWTIGGTLRGLGGRSPRLTLVEKGLEVSLQPEGRFVIGRLQAGQYTLEVIVDSQPARRFPITVPAPDYDLEL
jgi:Pvc16 N-terminal domain